MNRLNASESNLARLPSEVLSVICAHLSVREVHSLCRTCRRLVELIDDERFWLSVFQARERFSYFAPALFQTPPQWSGSWENRIALIDAARANWCFSNLQQQTLHGHTGDATITCSTVSQDGTLLVAKKGKLSAWRRRKWIDGESPNATVECRSTPTAIAANRDASLVVVGGSDSSVTLYRGKGTLSRSAALMGHRQAIRSIALLEPGNLGSAESQALCPQSSTSEIVASGSNDTTIRLHNARTRRLVSTLHGHGSPVVWLSPAAHGTQLLSFGNSDARLKQWDLEQSRCIETVRFSEPITSAIADVEHGARGDTVYVAFKNLVRVVDLRDRASVAAVLSLPSTWHRQESINALALRRDGLLVGGVGAEGVAVWDATGPWEARGLSMPRATSRSSSHRRITRMAVSTDSAFFGDALGRVSVLPLHGKAPIVNSFGSRTRSNNAVALLHVDLVEPHSVLVGYSNGLVHSFSSNHAGVSVMWERASAIVDGTGIPSGQSPFWRAEAEFER